MSIKQLEALVKMAPSKGEEEKPLSYKGDLNILDLDKKFVMALLNLPFAFQDEGHIIY